MKKVLTIVSLCLLFISASTENKIIPLYVNYIKSFTRYIEWPSEMNQGSFKIGVFGSFDLYKIIADETTGINLQGRTVDVLNLNRFENISISKLNILIVSKENCTRETIAKVRKYIGNTATLLITEKEGSCKIGSGINLITVNNKLVYELDKSNARLNGIRTGKQLEQFAYRVFE